MCRSHTRLAHFLVIAVWSAGIGCGGGEEQGSPCDALEPNDHVSTASELAVDASLEDCSLSSEDDYDIYSVTSSGLGYVTARITTSGSAVEASLKDETGATMQFDRAAAYWAMDAGETVEIWVKGSPDATYAVALEWTEISDPYEPNQDQSEAPLIPLSTTHQAALFAGTSSAAESHLRAFQDFYRLELQAGALELRVTEEPEWPIAIFELLSEDGSYVNLPLESVGDTTVYRADIAVPGAYFLRVRAGTVGEESPASLVAGIGTEVPPFFGETYSFELRQ